MSTNTIHTMIAILTLGIFMGFGPAYGETLVIEGNGIFITLDGEENIITLDTDDGYVVIFDSKMKTYNTGAFSLKNPDGGIALWAHPFSETQYRIVVLTNQGVHFIQQIIGTIVTLNDVTTTEPHSSVGVDISKWNIPTEGRHESTPYTKPAKVHDPDSLDVIVNVPPRIHHTYNLGFEVMSIDKQIEVTDKHLSDVDVSVKIFDPIGDIMRIWNGTTDDFGKFSDDYYIINYQMIGEYKLETILDKENYTSISKTVSFFVIPLPQDTKSKCPSGYFYNSTQQCKITP